LPSRKDTNNLISESSPYLLQHAHNPVNWYAWGEEAFGRAATENRLIFLSIGYSTCHWCHVMERESFEDGEVAVLMNRAYVSVKVDREERPDLDAVFMEAAMLLNRRGGWPLNLILTPAGKPFFAATYIPRTGNSYTAGMMELLPQIEEIWRNDPQSILDRAEQIVQALRGENGKALPVSSPVPSGNRLNGIRKAALADFKERFDRDYGGFYPEPKFPQPQNLLFLLREYHSSGDGEILEMVEKTLKRMRAGGIYDHVGYGFHRYSTDRKWLLPHFEKMLYDQAMLIMIYTEAFQLTGNREYGDTAEEIITYVLRDMRSEEGAFFSAEDADSEGREGKFYVWRYDDFIGLLNGNGFDGRQWADNYHLEREGNFADEAGRTKNGENILHVSPGAAVPEDSGRIGEILFREREKRIRPHRDDKILTDWNGRMITALAKAGWTFGRKEYVTAADRAARFFLGTMRDGEGALLHSYRRGRKHTPGMIDDYAFLIRGLLELYRADFNTDYIGWALELAGYGRVHFEDPRYGGFFQSPAGQKDLLIRKKILMDNAIPAGNSVMYENLMQLFKITGDASWRNSAEALLRSVSELLERYPTAFGMLLSSFDYAGPSGREIVVAGNRAEGEELVSAINRFFLPGTVLLFKTKEKASALSEMAPYTGIYDLPEDSAAAYICTGFTCANPLFHRDELVRALKPEKGAPFPITPPEPGKE